MVDVDDIVKEFLVESAENLDQLDRDLMALEESPEDRGRLSSVFRTIHTIKGTSGFLAFHKLEHVTHVGENLLVRLRDGALKLNQEIATALLSMVDAVRSILASIESTGAEGDQNFDVLAQQLSDLQTPRAAEIAVQDVIETLSPKPAAKAPSTPVTQAHEVDGLPEMQMVFCTPTIDEDEPFTPAAVEAAAPVSAPAAARGAQQVESSKAPEAIDRPGVVTESTVRIDVNILDNLMNLVGELVLARNQIMQFSQRLNDSAMASACQRLNLIATELQEGVMKTRMQPIGNAWNKLPRVVRDLSLQCGKQVQVTMEGADTELDKTILESIKDPLTHIVRNAVDHGIETSAVRVANGKPAEGTLHLRAFHEGGQVNIEISDDGGGINLKRVREKAIEKGLVNRQAAEALSDREALQLILLPGFSTAEKVTNVSGRGVGMDVVKTNIEKIGGVLEIQSVAGQGTVLRIKIPLTLAIVPALVIGCEGDRYCIPQVSLVELVRLDAEGVRTQIDLLHSVPVHRLRGRLLPLVYLDELLGLRPTRTQAERQSADHANIVVLQAEEQQFGLVVDRIEDTQEIVVKPLSQQLKRLEIYAGSTIMGDGGVSLILDVRGIAQQSSVLASEAQRAVRDHNSLRSDARGDSQSYLIVESEDQSRSAIRLSDVARLETVPTSAIELVSGQPVIQYRGEIMPLASLNGHGHFDVHGERLSLVVVNGPHRSVGVSVGRIVDIVDDSSFDSDDQTEQRIIAGRITEIVDLRRVAERIA